MIRGGFDVKKRYLAVALLVLCVIVRFVPTNRVRVVNESGRTARALSVEVCGARTHLRDVPPGGSASCRFGTPSQDDYITVRARLDDGTTIDEPCVYVVWEEYFCGFVVVIREDGTVAQRW